MGSLIYFNIGDGKQVWLPKHLGYEKDLLKQLELEFKPHLNQSKALKWTVKKTPNLTDVVGPSGQGIIENMILRYAHSVQQGKLKKSLYEEQDIDKFYELAVKTLPPIHNQLPGIDNMENLYFGAELGVIKKRKNDGSWESIQTNVISDINIVRYLPEGSLLVANKNGEILLGLDNNTKWEVVTKFSKKENIEDIDILDDKVYVVTSVYDGLPFMAGGENYELKVYELSASSLENRSIIYSENRKLGYLPHAKIIDNNYYIGLAPDSLDVIDLNTKKINQLKLPQKFTDFNVSDKGVITLYNRQGAFSDLFISNDNGGTWSELKTPTYTIGTIFFETPEKGHAYRISTGAFDVTYILQKYQPKKRKKWVNVSKAPEDCKYILHDEKYYPKFCVSKSDEIYSISSGEWYKEINIL
ncbi:hypothetical protein C1E23_20730 [Pseudoalteromonas phenolica]|uniref:Uncharacterized protein n=1 Tax=Pseudoalteromonas phenolica TaxID=161398 RepID=A0A4Q7IJY7_9GAMM|nr:hypothetical protein C1E23_20730 [Pseudoalteromonas phenolica]